MAETIKDFLVSLGWDIKESEQKRFVDAMRTAELQAKLLADALEALARKAWETVSDIAEAFDRLYFSSQRTQATVATIRDFGYAVKQLGGSAEAAQASLEAMGQKLRENPGNIAYLNALGLGLNKVTGALEVQQGLLEKSRNMPLSVAELYRERAGMDERTFLALRDPQFLRLMEEAAEVRKRIGFDPDQAAKDANAFMSTWRRVSNELGVIADDLFTKIMKALNGPFEEFKKFIDANGSAIGKDIDLIADALGRMADSWVKSFESILKDPQAMDHFQQGMRRLAEDVKWLADSFHSFIDDLRWLNDKAEVIANTLNKFAGANPVGGGKYPGEIGMDQLPNGDPSAQGNPSASDGPAAGGSGIGDAWRNSTVGKWWGRTMPSILGGDSGQTGSADHVSSSGPIGGKQNGNFTSENAQAVIAAAKELGTTPEDLATVIGYETGGSYSPSQWGGAGGRYMGLIQFGPAERNQFGVTEGQSFPDQMKSVTAYLKARGFKPGMGLLDLYSTINAGSPGHYNASDGNGTVSSHVARMQQERAAQARSFLSLANGGDAYRTFGDLYKDGQTFGHTITGATDKGAMVDGQWLPFWAHLPGSPENTGQRVASGGASAAEVQNDNAAGAAQIKKWEGAKANPWGSLNDYWGGSMLGGNGGDATHVNAPVTNNFHIDGANDPSIVAHMVAANQKRVVADMTRNLVGATN